MCGLTLGPCGTNVARNLTSDTFSSCLPSDHVAVSRKSRLRGRRVSRDERKCSQGFGTQISTRDLKQVLNCRTNECITESQEKMIAIDLNPVQYGRTVD